MGDRAQVHIHNGNKDRIVVLYTHWSGTELPETVKTSLIRGKNRWDDSAYLARMVFCDMVRDDPDGESGYGIAAHPLAVDGESQVISLNCWNQTLSFTGDWGDHSGETYSFETYVSGTGLHD